MSSVVLSLSSELQYFFRVHPEWWTVPLCGTAWTVMLLHAWRYAAHGIHHRMSFEQELPYWMWMVLAMMLPLALNTARLTAARSLWWRRHRAIAGFLIGYLTPWLALGVAVAALRQASWTHTPAAAGVCFALAAAWRWTSIHRRAIAACHRAHPLAPRGWRADCDCLRYGGNIGTACLRSCWPMMLACALTGHSLIAMSLGMALQFAERRPLSPPRRTLTAATLVLAGYYVVMACFDLSGIVVPAHVVVTNVEKDRSAALHHDHELTMCVRQPRWGSPEELRRSVMQS